MAHSNNLNLRNGGRAAASPKFRIGVSSARGALQLVDRAALQAAFLDRQVHDPENGFILDSYRGARAAVLARQAIIEAPPTNDEARAAVRVHLAAVTGESAGQKVLTFCTTQGTICYPCSRFEQLVPTLTGWCALSRYYELITANSVRPETVSP